MTISTTTSRISYNGNGVTTIFAVPFRFFANTDLVVELVTVSTGASSTLIFGTHYTVTGADDEDGGSLTMPVAPAVGQRLVIRRVIAATQEVDYVAGDPFPAETHERALDRLTMLAQQGEEVNARALVFPSGDTASGELPAVVARASRLLGFDNMGNLVTSAPASGSAADLALSLAGTGGAELVGFDWAALPAAINKADWGLHTARTALNILRLIPVAEWPAILAGTSTYDATAAFTTAQTLSKDIYAPAGRYVLNGLRIQNQVRIRGAGLVNTNFVQALPGVPAINCLSDITVGQLRAVELLDFNVIGATSATVAAVYVGARGAYAVYESTFRFNATNTYSALEQEGLDAANVFWCDFYVYSVNTTGPAVYLHGGAYNTYDLFLVTCFGLAIDNYNSASIFKRVAVEGGIREAGQKNIWQNPTIEALPNVVGTIVNPFYDTGFSNTWNKPSIILYATDVAKVTGAVFRTFVGTEVTDPQFIFPSASKVANPFEESPYEWSLYGPGRSECINKIEVLWDGSNSNRNLRNINMSGVSASLTSVGQFGTAATQYLAPSAPFNFQVNPRTDSILWEPTGTLAFVNMGLLGGFTPRDGQTLTISSTQTITTINWFAGIDCTRCPATIAANTSFTIVYRAANNSFYRA